MPKSAPRKENPVGKKSNKARASDQKATVEEINELLKELEMPEGLNALSAMELGWLTRIFYRDGFRTAKNIIVVQFAIICLLVAAVLYKSSTVEERYFAVGPDGRFHQMTPLDKPLLSNRQLVQWATECMSRSYVFDFLNYMETLNRVSVECFTREGAKKYQAAMANHVKSVREGELVARVVLDQPVAIDASGQIGDIYAWRLSAPVTVYYDGYGIEKRSNKRLMEITVVRTPDLDGSQGVAISQWDLRLVGS